MGSTLSSQDPIEPSSLSAVPEEEALKRLQSTRRSGSGTAKRIHRTRGLGKACLRGFGGEKEGKRGGGWGCAGRRGRREKRREREVEIRTPL